MERERGFLKYERVENIAHMRVVTFISYTDVIYIYIYSFRILRKLKQTQPQKIRARSESYYEK